MEDKLLVIRCKRGSAEALERIYEKYRKGMLILAVALLHNTNAAEDVVHDVFTGFVRDIEKFRLTGSLKGYLAKNHASLESNPVEYEDSNLNEPVSTIVCNEQLQQLSNAMTGLPYDQRETIMLHFQAGLTFQSIAQQQGISVNTIKSRYKYGIEKLRTILDSEAKNERGR